MDLEFDDEGVVDESGNGGEPSNGGTESSSSSSSESRNVYSDAPLRHLAKVSHRNEAAIASIMASMESLRTLVSSRESDFDSSGTTQPSLSSLNQSMSAFVTRLKVQSRMASSRESVLRGAPSAAVDQVLQSVQALTEETGRYESSFPKHVRHVSAATLSLCRNELAKAHAAVGVLANKASLTRQQYENELQASTSGLVAEAKSKMLAAKGDLLRSRLFQELISDCGRVLDMLGSNVQFGNSTQEEDPETQLSYAAESIVSHLATLNKATLSQDVQREVECVRLAFGELVSALRAYSAAPHQARSSSSSASTIPRRLLAQVTNPQRRAELSSMEPSKAASLLQHTREALVEMDPGSVQYKKLRVVEEILVLRAQQSQAKRSSASATPPPPSTMFMAEKWQLQKSGVDSELRRLLHTVGIARGAEDKVIAAREKTMSRATAELHKAATTHLHRVSAVLDEKLSAWRVSMDREYRSGADKMLTAGQELVTRIIAALEVFVSTGIGSRGRKRGAGAAGAGSGTLSRRSSTGPSSRFRPHVHSQSGSHTHSQFDFDTGEDAGGEDREEDEDGDDEDDLAALLRRMYELTLEVFTAWEKVANMVLRVNGYGMKRAEQKVMTTIEPLRNQFESLVRSCGGGMSASE